MTDVSALEALALTLRPGNTPQTAIGSWAPLSAAQLEVTQQTNVQDGEIRLTDLGRCDYVVTRP